MFPLSLTGAARRPLRFSLLLQCSDCGSYTSLTFYFSGGCAVPARDPLRTYFLRNSSRLGAVSLWRLEPPAYAPVYDQAVRF
ncbi:MAG TPA: hypothetical protein ACQGQI_05370 [Xylella sp.]